MTPLTRAVSAAAPREPRAANPAPCRPERRPRRRPDGSRRPQRRPAAPHRRPRRAAAPGQTPGGQQRGRGLAGSAAGAVRCQREHRPAQAPDPPGPSRRPDPQDPRAARSRTGQLARGQRPPGRVDVHDCDHSTSPSAPARACRPDCRAGNGRTRVASSTAHRRPATPAAQRIPSARVHTYPGPPPPPFPGRTRLVRTMASHTTSPTDTPHTFFSMTRLAPLSVALNRAQLRRDRWLHDGGLGRVSRINPVSGKCAKRLPHSWIRSCEWRLPVPCVCVTAHPRTVPRQLLEPVRALVRDHPLQPVARIKPVGGSTRWFPTPTRSLPCSATTRCTANGCTGPVLCNTGANGRSRSCTGPVLLDGFEQVPGPQLGGCGCR